MVQQKHRPGKTFILGRNFRISTFCLKAPMEHCLHGLLQAAEMKMMCV
jgi:hypothetical protein